MATPETQKNSPANAPAKQSGGDMVLKNFRATLETRWEQFDQAAIVEAGQFSSMRLSHPNYIKAKEAFDNAKKMLSSIENDADLKSKREVLTTVESTIQSLTEHLKKLKPEEQKEAINVILANTASDLADFKAKITDNLADKKAAEVAKAAVPVVALASAAGGAALATEAANGLSSAVSEGAQDLGKEVAAIKKNPMKKIAEFFGFTDSGIASDIKEALAEKKAGGFEGFFASIKLWFYGLMAKFTGADLSASLTPEEMKLAGIKGPVVPKNPVEPQAEKAEAVKKGLSNEVYRVTTGFLIRGTNQVRYGNVITNIYAGVRDATWGNGEIEQKQMIENEAITLLSSEGSKLRTISYSDIAKKSESEILTLVGHGSALDLRKSAIQLIQKMLGENKNIFEKVFSDIPEWDKMPLDKIIGILYQEKGYQNISQMHSRLESIKLSDIGDIPKNLFLDLSWKDGNLVIGDGIFSSRYDAMKSAGLTPGLIKKLHIDNETAESVVSQFRGNISTIGNDAEKKFADNFTKPENFLLPLQASLKQKFGYSDALIAEMSTEKLKVRDLFDLYVITGGKTNIDQLNIGEKNLLLTKLQAYFIGKNPEEHGKYIANILQSPDKYPEVIQAFEIMSSLVNKASYKASLLAAGVTDNILDSVLGFFDIDTKSKKAVALTASIGVIWLAMKLLPIGRLISLITLILASLGIAGFATAQQGVKK